MENNLPRGVVFSYKPLLQRLKISLFKIEVCSTDKLFKLVVDSHPINNLRCILSEKGAVCGIEWLPILSRYHPDVRVATIAHVPECFFKLC